MATFAHGTSTLMQVPTDKLHVVGDRIIVACTGSVGLAQRFVGIVEEQWKLKVIFNKSAMTCAKSLSKFTIEDFQSTHVQRTQNIGIDFGAMVAAPLNDRPHLIEYDTVNFQPEIRQGKLNFLSMGGGQILAEPFLAFINRVLWKSEIPDVKTAVFGVFWALSYALEIAPGGVGHPIEIATLKKRGGQWKAELLSKEILQEQGQHISDVENRIGDLPAEVIKQAGGEEPPAPPA